jgi:membrane protein implicated in regulation of membrane protease activity
VIAFLIIGGIGFVMLVATWVVGEIFDFGHDIAGWFGDHEINVDGHQIEIGGGAGGDVGPSPLSSRVIFAFLTAFGGGGAIASLYQLSMGPSLAVAIGSGLAVGAATWGVANLLFQQAASSTIQSETLVGRDGRVEVTIPAGGAGQVAVSAGGGSNTWVARNRSGQAIAAGSAVRVVEAQGNLLVVEPAIDAAPAAVPPAR